MRAVVQRVTQASVISDDRVCGKIEKGLLVYLGVLADDHGKDVTYLAEKVRFLRIFSDKQDRMNLDVVQAGGKILVVSAFTVCADARRGRRPTLDQAAPREEAIQLYESFCQSLIYFGVQVERGSYGDAMNVHSHNDGPICILVDSKKVF